jgi:hypothetical protein
MWLQNTMAVRSKPSNLYDPSAGQSTMTKKDVTGRGAIWTSSSAAPLVAESVARATLWSNRCMMHGGFIWGDVMVRVWSDKTAASLR